MCVALLVTLDVNTRRHGAYWDHVTQLHVLHTPANNHCNHVVWYRHEFFVAAGATHAAVTHTILTEA